MLIIILVIYIYILIYIYIFIILDLLKIILCIFPLTNPPELEHLPLSLYIYI
jgi:hypothetical protein